MASPGQGDPRAGPPERKRSRSAGDAGGPRSQPTAPPPLPPPADPLGCEAEELTGVAVELLDELLVDSCLDSQFHGGQAQPGATREAAGGVALRCLDSSHGGGCQRCRDAPGEEVAEKFALVGDVGKKNGEKKLRAQLATIDEWRDGGARAEAAAAATADGDDALALALSLRDTSRLRKRHLFALCRRWGYRSEVWQCKARPAAPSALPSVRALVSAATLSRADALRAHIHGGDLGRLVSQAARLAQGVAGRDALRAASWRAVTPFALAEWQGVMAVSRHLELACAAAHSDCLRARDAVFPPSGRAPSQLDPDSPAYRHAHTPGFPPSDQLFARLRFMFGSSLALIQQRALGRPPPDSALSPDVRQAEALYFSEPEESSALTLDWISRCEALLAQLLAGSLGDFALASSELTGAARAALSQLDAAGSVRVAWLQEELAAESAEVDAGFRAREAAGAACMAVDWASVSQEVAAWPGGHPATVLHMLGGNLEGPLISGAAEIGVELA